MTCVYLFFHSIYLYLFLLYFTAFYFPSDAFLSVSSFSLFFTLFLCFSPYGSLPIYVLLLLSICILPLCLPNLDYLLFASLSLPFHHSPNFAYLLLFSPTLSITCVYMYIFLEKRKGGGYLTRTMGKRDTGCLASQFKGVW
jgi:hypothetical protein